MHVIEYYGSPNSKVYEYKENKNNHLVQQIKPNAKRFNFFLFLKAVFLPQGYPESVSKDYMQYQIWDTIQAFCSSITGTLATHAVLKGSGVGDESATVVAATMTWLLKDGTGMVGRIAFAYFYGTSLDANAKQWRLFADVLNDCAICIQLVAPMLPKIYFTSTMCAAGLAFSLVGVAGGCTRAALTMHQAKRNNMADVSAKDGSQETLVNLMALITSLMMTPLLANNPLLTWTLFLIFTVLHIYANYQAVSSVVMETFNRHRFDNAVDHYVAYKALKPPQANYSEPLFKVIKYDWLQLGCKLQDLELSEKELEDVMSKCKTNNQRFITQLRKGVVYVALQDQANPQDILEACFYAFLLHKHFPSSAQDGKHFLNEMSGHGWDLTKHHMCADEWRWSQDKAFRTDIKHKVS
uniref:UPF0420 protein C16orf58 homolog n=1 Tax=Phallusia mammillata TaxID=59560 RepID=A0A6F9D8H4_9ASCI|nr:UPF0420 protein C16orf58 homolog [Phallusia mammillata]